MSIEILYAERCKKPDHFPDIWEHLPTLREYAGRFSHVTEFGVRTGNSTIAFLAALYRNGGKLRSYDIESRQFAVPLLENVDWEFKIQDTGAYDFTIEPTDLLFIDSNHDYQHVVKELRHAKQVKHNIILHDTSPNWIGGTGPLRAMVEFVTGGNGWGIDKHFDNCNGLTILHRK